MKAIIAIGEIGYDWWTNKSTQDIVSSQIDEALKNKATEIEFQISSFGGDVYQALALYEKIKALEVPTTANIIGYCMSAGTVIACGCNRIIAGSASTFMIHDAKWWAEGNKEAMEIAKKELTHIDNILAQIYHQKTGLEIEEIKRMMSANREQGTVMNAKEAKKLNFVDIIDNFDYKEKVKKAIAASHKPLNSMSNEKSNLQKALDKFLGKTNSKTATKSKPKAMDEEEKTAMAVQMEPGTYTLEDGTTFEVDENGVAFMIIEEEEMAEKASAETVEAIKSMIADASKEQITTLDKKIDALSESLASVVNALAGNDLPKGKLDKNLDAQIPKASQSNQALERFSKSKNLKPLI